MQGLWGILVQWRREGAEKTLWTPMELGQGRLLRNILIGQVVAFLPVASFPTAETGVSRQQQHAEQQLCRLRGSCAPGAAPPGGREALPPELLQVSFSGVWGGQIREGGGWGSVVEFPEQEMRLRVIKPSRERVWFEWCSHSREDLWRVRGVSPQEKAL